MNNVSLNQVNFCKRQNNKKMVIENQEESEKYPTHLEDRNDLCAMRMPKPKEVAEGLSVATGILIGIKSVIQAFGDLVNTIRENFKINKEEALLKKAYNTKIEDY